MSTTDPRTVLLVSDDDAFLRQLTDCWQGERVIPAFLVAADAAAFRSNFDLAIVGRVTEGITNHVRTVALGCATEPSSATKTNLGSLGSTLTALDAISRPLIILVDSPEALAAIRREFPRALAIVRHEAWPETLVALATEVLRRSEAVRRAERAEQLNQALKRNATLGQYVIDMRHSLNNALTSVLGNAELLLLEPGTFSAVAHSQLDTIRHMSLRMHEILQRFSSLEKELSFAEKQAAKEGGSRPIAAPAP